MSWRQVACSVCGLAYRAFRAPGQPDFDEAKQAMLMDSRRRARAGDYSKPADRRAVLGWMHGHKRAAWEEHVHYCEEGQT